MKDQHAKASDRNDDSRRDDGSRRRDGDASVWRHDGFFEMEANPNRRPPPAARKRPAFREQKAPAEAEDVLHKSKEDAGGPGGPGHLGERKEDRERYSSHWERPERTFARESMRSNRRDDSRGGFSPRERFIGGNRNMGRDKYNGRQGYSRSGGNHTPVEKWKHDLFDEANRSPSPKNEEERIAKIEALLAS